MLPPEAKARFLPSKLLCARLNIYKSALTHGHLGPLFMRAFWLQNLFCGCITSFAFVACSHSPQFRLMYKISVRLINLGTLPISSRVLISLDDVYEENTLQCCCHLVIITIKHPSLEHLILIGCL